MHLAIDWVHVTGKAPESGCSDRKGFGCVVHSICDSLDAPKSGTQATIDAAIEAATESASYALRRYWDFWTPAPSAEALSVTTRAPSVTWRSASRPNRK